MAEDEVIEFKYGNKKLFMLWTNQELGAMLY